MGNQIGQLAKVTSLLPVNSATPSILNYKLFRLRDSARILYLERGITVHLASGTGKPCVRAMAEVLMIGEIVSSQK